GLAFTEPRRGVAELDGRVSYLKSIRIVHQNGMRSGDDQCSRFACRIRINPHLLRLFREGFQFSPALTRVVRQKKRELLTWPGSNIKKIVIVWINRHGTNC